MTVSYSVYRSKIRVIPLGQTSSRGYGLGTRLVAGSMIRSVFTTDKITSLQEGFYTTNQNEIKNRLLGLDNTTPNKVPKEQPLTFMKDDLAHFNIHFCAQSEDLSYDSITKKWRPFTRYEVILGCVIINSGQVFSIEDLITESTVQFEAKSVQSLSDITKQPYNRGYSYNTSLISGSDLI